MAFRLYRFDGFELDTYRRELRRDGAPVGLPPKSFDCLAYLVEQRARASVCDSKASLTSIRPQTALISSSRPTARARCSTR